MKTTFDKIFLGIYQREKIYLSKHSWDCGWYWGFGYVGNRNQHFHFESLLNLKDIEKGCGIQTDVNKIFSSTWIDENLWWILRDLFIQAYALRRVAEVYHYGGHQVCAPGVTDIIKNPEMEKIINKDLEQILDKIWNILNENYAEHGGK